MSRLHFWVLFEKMNEMVSQDVVDVPFVDFGLAFGCVTSCVLKVEIQYSNLTNPVPPCCSTSKFYIVFNNRIRISGLRKCSF